MPLPAVVTYNDLNGEEVRQILENRYQQFLDTIPYFQRHLTLPRVRITTNVKLELWADQPAPDVVALGDKFEVVVEGAHLPVEVIVAESVDSTSPTGGDPPDRIRAMHGLAIPQPARGQREIGGQVAVADQFILDGNEVELMPGLKVSRTGSGLIAGMPTSANATVAQLDQGPAGLRRGEMNRDQWHFGGKK